MKIHLRICILIVLLGIPGVLYAQSIQLNVTYVCGGEHIYVDYCATSEADTARCAIAHPDKLYNRRAKRQICSLKRGIRRSNRT